MGKPNSVNYVISAYFGYRKDEDPDFERDRSIYLRTHLEQLVVLKHRLTKVTVVVSKDNTAIHKGRDHDVEFGYWHGLVHRFSGYVEKLPGFEILVRENAGMCYGAFSDVARLNPKMDHIFMQDDWVPFGDNFDRRIRKFANELEAAHGPDFYLSFQKPDGFKVAPNGYLNKRALKTILADLGSPAYVREPNPWEAYETGEKSRGIFPHPRMARFDMSGVTTTNISYFGRKDHIPGFRVKREGQGPLICGSSQLLTLELDKYIEAERLYVENLREGVYESTRRGRRTAS